MTASSSARGFLLDTHTALWAVGQPEALSTGARRAVLAGPNFLSAVSYWEVVIKCMKGTLDVGDPRLWWAETLEKLVARPLPLRPDHVGALWTLPPLHKDPFDRILIAQARLEGLTLVSADAEVARYSPAGLQVIR